MRLLYFAWIAEKIGRSSEELSLGEDITTVAQLIHFLKNRGENYQAAFACLDLVRVALDQHLVEHDAGLVGVSEIAFFPPMTGG